MSSFELDALDRLHGRALPSIVVYSSGVRRLAVPEFDDPEKEGRRLVSQDAFVNVSRQRYFIQCNDKYTSVMDDVSERWLVLVVRVPAEPSRHRVGVWRELRRLGAVPLGQGSWVVPDVPAVVDAVARACELAARGDGEIVVLVAQGRADFDAARLRRLFTDQRQEEWVEFLADCTKFDVEIDKEIRIDKLTFAELEEEEQGLERLRRWYKAIKVRDVFGAPSAAAAEQQLKHCAQRLDEYTQLVFAAQHQN